MNLRDGDTFAARYRVIRKIARGGMGTVYEVAHTRTDRRHALKLLQPHIVESRELRERFEQEARAAARIESEHIVDVLDAGVDDATESPFLVMELLRGEELGQRLARLGRFSPSDAVSYLWQTALALDKTHDAGIIHRDLKPGNLFLADRADGSVSVKVLDFGVAKFVAETATMSGGTRSVGTPIYMSPEQFRAQRVTPATDLYALAMVAFHFLVGKAYWAPEASDEIDVVAFALIATMGLPEPASARAARYQVELPEGFDAWFARAAATQPAARFLRATTMIESLAVLFGVPLAPVAGSEGRVAAGSRASESAAPAVAPTPQPPTEPLRQTAVASIATGAPVSSHSSASTERGKPAAPPLLWVLSTVGVMAIIAGIALGARYLVSSGSPSAAPSNAPAAPAVSSATQATIPSVAVVATPTVGASVTAVPTPSAAPTASAKPPPPPAIEWRVRRECIIENNACTHCCLEDEIPGPYPACQCLFNGTQWDLEHRNMQR